MNTVHKTLILTIAFVVLSISVNAVPVVWDNILNMNISGTSYVKTAANNWGNAGMGSANELQPGENGHMQWTLLDNAYGDVYLLGLSDVDASYNWNTNDYAFYLYNLTGSPFAYIRANGTWTYIGAFNTGDVFKIERLGATVRFYRNGSFLTSASTSTSLPMVVDAAVYSTGEGGMNIDVEASFDVPGEPTSPKKAQYVELQKKLDGSYHWTNNGFLSIKYMENYAITFDENDEADYKIYDMQRNELVSNTVTSVYGPNWKTLSVSTLPEGAFYILELIGPNKGEKYYLRFYKGDKI